MDSASFQFILFGLLVALVSNFSRTMKWRSGVLLVASLVFIVLIAPHAELLLPLTGFLALGYISLLLIRRGWTRSALWSIPVVILVYAWLKKYTFLPEATFLHWPYLTLGLSYIFFRVLHLIIDAKDDSEQARIGVIPYLLYCINFTTLVSGPIQLYSDFAREQLTDEPEPLTVGIIGSQLERIIRGFFKVNVVAMILHALQDDALLNVSLATDPAVKMWAVFRLVVIYPFFLYCNFSGYIDIVIAIARLMRIRLPENFNRPFSATCFIDFWNHWHITLSTWLKIYVYNPVLRTLMGKIQSQAIQPYIGVFGFFVTFFLVGIWHGRTSEFVVFGLLQGGGVAVNKLWQIWITNRLGRKKYRSVSQTPLYLALGRGLTFTWFGFTLLWFWGAWHAIYKVLDALTLAQWAGAMMATILIMSAVLYAWEVLRRVLLSISTPSGPVLHSRYARVAFASALCFIAIIMTMLLNAPAPDIVYKAF